MGAQYTNIDTFKDAVDEFARLKGFEVRRGGRKLHCYRGYASEKEAERHRYKTDGVPMRKRISILKCGCDWNISFATDATSVTITNVSLAHTNGCNPSRKEKLTLVTKSTKPKEIDTKVYADLLRIPSTHTTCYWPSFVYKTYSISTK